MRNKFENVGLICIMKNQWKSLHLICKEVGGIKNFQGVQCGQRQAVEKSTRQHQVGLIEVK